VSARDADPIRADVGLCPVCTHAQVQQSARGSRFWRCLRADDDPRFRRYPPLPVRACPGLERRPGSPPSSAPG
jgi:hypothetical protein